MNLKVVWFTTYIASFYIILFSGARATLLDQESENRNHKLVCDQLISQKIYLLYLKANSLLCMDILNLKVVCFHFIRN